MWVNTSKCCTANTADLWSIDLQGLGSIIASRTGAVVRSFCCSIHYLLKECLLAIDIFLLKASLRDSLVQLVTGSTLIEIPSFVGVLSNRGSLRSISWPMKRSGHCWLCSRVKNHCFCSRMKLRRVISHLVQHSIIVSLQGRVALSCASTL